MSCVTVYIIFTQYNVDHKNEINIAIVKHDLFPLKHGCNPGFHVPLAVQSSGRMKKYGKILHNIDVENISRDMKLML